MGIQSVASPNAMTVGLGLHEMPLTPPIDIQVKMNMIQVKNAQAMDLQSEQTSPPVYNHSNAAVQRQQRRRT